MELDFSDKIKEYNEINKDKIIFLFDFVIPKDINS